MPKGGEGGTALFHEHGGHNLFRKSAFEVDIAPAYDAPIKVTREISTARQCMSPLEGRGVVATFDHRLDQLTLLTAAQMPTSVATAWPNCLALGQGQIGSCRPETAAGGVSNGNFCPAEGCLSLLRR